MIYLDSSTLVKLAVEEAESEALLAALEGRGPYVTSAVGAIETVRACRHVNVPATQVEELEDGLVVLAIDDDIRRLAGAVAPPMLRTLDAIHLASALTLRDDIDGFITYDARLAQAAAEAGLTVLTPS